MTPGEESLHLVEIFIGVCIGSITFTGSVIAFLKLQRHDRRKPLLLPGRHMINIVMLADHDRAWRHVLHVAGTRRADGRCSLATILTGILGVHFVMAIGGADMPVVVSMLNSYSGWAAAAAGFMLGNDLLIITGALVGSAVRS